MQSHLLKQLGGALLVGVLAALPTAAATDDQAFAIDWFAIGGGGDVASDETYSLEGIIGQTEAGTLAGGTYALTGGFWSIAAELLPPEAPVLSIRRLADGSVMVSWSASVSGYRLQVAPVLGDAFWANGTAPVVDVGDEHTVTVPANSSMQYYRLRWVP